MKAKVRKFLSMENNVASFTDVGKIFKRSPPILLELT